ncbi:hypothetical protein HDU99_005127, partial [Rhizoclosmatium hyalinum]
LHVDKVSNFFVRWILLQLIFIGDSVLDTCIKMAVDSQYFAFRDHHPNDQKTNLTAAALSGLASALGMGGSVKEDKRYSREGASSPSGLGKLTAQQENMKKRSTSSS